MKRLAGRVAVVTGAGSGIGRASALALADRGAHLALVDVAAGGIGEVAEMLAAVGRRPTTHVVDVADAERMDVLAAEVVAAHGAVHIVVNNAGVTSAGRFVDEPLGDLRWLVGINLWGVVHGCRSFLPHLLDVEEAHIVNVSSMVAFLGLPQNAIYAASKGAVRSFTEALRGELVGTSVGVTAVFPGAVNTNIMSTARGAEAARIAGMASSPLVPFLLRSPEVVARRIVRAIDRDQARAVVGPDARLLDLAARLVPGRSKMVGRALDRFTSPRMTTARGVEST